MTPMEREGMHYGLLPFSLLTEELIQWTLVRKDRTQPQCKSLPTDIDD